MPKRSAPRSAAIYGIDIGKNIFRVIALGSDGPVVQRVGFRRDTLLQFFQRAARAIIGMESCAGSQWIARKIKALGHKVRLIPVTLGSVPVITTPLRERPGRGCNTS